MLHWWQWLAIIEASLSYFRYFVGQRNLLETVAVRKNFGFDNAHVLWYVYAQERGASGESPLTYLLQAFGQLASLHIFLTCKHVRGKALHTFRHYIFRVHTVGDEIHFLAVSRVKHSVFHLKTVVARLKCQCLQGTLQKHVSLHLCESGRDGELRQCRAILKAAAANLPQRAWHDYSCQLVAMSESPFTNFLKAVGKLHLFEFITPLKGCNSHFLQCRGQTHLGKISWIKSPAFQFFYSLMQVDGGKPWTSKSSITYLLNAFWQFYGFQIIAWTK